MVKFVTAKKILTWIYMALKKKRVHTCLCVCVYKTNNTAIGTLNSFLRFCLLSPEESRVGLENLNGQN